MPRGPTLVGEMTQSIGLFGDTPAGVISLAVLSLALKLSALASLYKRTTTVFLGVQMIGFARFHARTGQISSAPLTNIPVLFLFRAGGSRSDVLCRWICEILQSAKSLSSPQVARFSLPTQFGRKHLSVW